MKHSYSPRFLHAGKVFMVWTLTVPTLFTSSGANAGDPPDPTPISTPGPIDPNFPTQPHPGRFVEHLDQMLFHDLIEKGRREDASEMAIEKGDDFFDNL